MKNKKIMFGIIIGIVFLLMVGLSYAYFTGMLTTDEGPNNMVTQTGILTLTYVDGPQVIAENIRPGWEITKTVSVENTGSLPAFYSINWKSINNTVERGELIMSSTCIGTDCKAIEEEVIGNAAGPFVSGIRIEPEAIQTYTFTFKLKEMSSVQNYNQGKIFNGVLNVEESVETFTLRGTLLDSSDNPIQNAQLTLHSEPLTTITDAEGKFTFENVEVGNHTIEGINGSSLEILDDTISFNSGESFNISGTTIIKESSNKEINVEIKLGGTNNISNISKIPTLIEKMNLALAQSDLSIDFSKTNDGIGCTYNPLTKTYEEFGNKVANSNGQGLYYTSDLTKTEDGKVVYYYRGAVENNYVVFAGYCWRIVRTNENGSIKLYYGGKPTGESRNYTCPQTGTSIGINNQQTVLYNQTIRDNTYVGYMMGLNNSGTSTLSNAQSNTYDSNIKSVIDDWYENNIVNQGTEITSKIANTIYCNDRSVGNSGVINNHTYTSSAYGQNDVLYASFRRLGAGGPTGTTWSSANASPQYKCPNVSRDGFTLSIANGGTAGYGNNKLTYPIGLLTADELSYSGSAVNAPNNTFYLYTPQSSWTMTPLIFASAFSTFVNSSTGYLNSNTANLPFVVLPVISLNSSVLVSNGMGEYNSPYEIE